MSERRVAVVTGGTRGLGHQIARRLVTEGFKVAVAARSSDAPGIGEGFYRSLDVGKPEAVRSFVADVVARFGRVDVLVNNAGYANPSTPLAETDDSVFAACFETNVVGPASFMKHVLPIMARQPEGGAVVNVASRAGLTPVPGLAAYSASKSALIAFTLAAAKEFATGTVFLVALCPAGMSTEMRARVYGKEDAVRQMDVSKVADLAVELATRRSANGARVASGSAVLVTKEEGPTVLEWPRDPRGHQSVRFS